MTHLEINFATAAQAVMRERGTWRGSRTRFSDIRAVVEEFVSLDANEGDGSFAAARDAVINELQRRTGFTTTLEAYR